MAANGYVKHVKVAILNQLFIFHFQQPHHNNESRLNNNEKTKCNNKAFNLWNGQKFNF